MAIDLIITTAGRAALVNAVNTGTAPVVITQVGLSATAVVATPALTVLAGEIKRISGVPGEVVAPDTIHINMTDESADAYDLRSFALYLADGTLFGIYGQAGPLITKTASSIAAIAIDVVFADISAALLSFGDALFTNPPATTERQGVVELATVAEAQAGIDALRALTPVGAKAAVLGWLLAQDGAGSGLDADLLDGQHGSWYADIAARLGYTPANRAGDNFTGTVTVSGDFRSARPDGLTGIVYLDLAGTRYLLNNGSSYVLPGQSLFVNSAIAWTAGNDGAGSGLDADLLDGQHGAYYLPTASYTAADVLAKLVAVDGAGSGLDADLLDGQHGAYYLPAASYTAADVLTKLITVDGAGSGLDADLLDGQQGSWYADIVARLGFTPVNKAGDTIAGNLTVAGDVWTYRAGGLTGIVFLDQAGNRYLLNNGSAYVLPGQSLFVNGGIAWTSVNDGAGSGLDADLLDGQHAAAFLLGSSFTGANQVLAGTGRQRLPGGLILQWGQQAHADASGTAPVVFPDPFPNAGLIAFASNLASAPPTVFHATGGITAAGMNVYSATSSGAAAPSGAAFSWLAIGY